MGAEGPGGKQGAIREKVNESQVVQDPEDQERTYGSHRAGRHGGHRFKTMGSGDRPRPV